MCQSTFFNPKWKLREHILLLFLVVLLLVLTGTYLNLAPFITPPDIMGIVYSIKSIFIVAYQLLTEHTRRFARWKILKANFILNCMESVFWLTLIVLKFMGISRFCIGSSCAVAWVGTFVVIIILPKRTVVRPRPHPKTRTGCRTCKRRRVKCDESRPSCRRCIKSGLPCDFIIHGASSASPAVPVDQDPLPPPQHPVSTVSSPCEINLMDLELMHNFTTFTYTTMVSDPAVRQLLRTTAVHMAADCEYLMRSILAVSALHLSRYRPQKKALYLQRAMDHHQAASAAAIELLADLQADECERLHLFSMLTIYYAIACPVNEADLEPGSPLIPNWLRLLHGMEPILHVLNPQNYRGTLTPLFEFGRSRMLPFLRTTPPRDPNLLVDVQSLIHRTCANPDLILIYDDMIEQLRRVLGLILTPPRGAMGATHVHSHGSSVPQTPGGATMPGSSPSGAAGAGAAPEALPWTKLEAWDILIWQWTQGKHFLPLLDAVDPPQEALVIFAYCLLVVRKLESQWYVEGWADHLMGKTWALLDAEHRHWVVWATEEMGWIPPR
ncbi:sterol uptake control protein 2 [Dichotomopilus funicola]|uniref:Sterol uptake control protein 2 n=1 Tax=Dichotomopilus funicola TaxID=1934379 RepID=A0AAN6V1N8_9PEZI|nr:sterol uptake control protein 2 [Dichotomopilus funicola]